MTHTKVCLVWYGETKKRSQPIDAVHKILNNLLHTALIATVTALLEYLN